MNDTSRVLAPDSLSWVQMLEAQADGVALIDDSGTIGYANERFVAMTGYPLEQVVGQPIEFLIPQRHRGAHPTHRDKFAKRPSSREMGVNSILTLLRHDGSELAIDVALSPIVVNDRNWVAAFVRDDTERRAIEVARSENELRFRLAFEENVAPMIFTNLEHEAFAVNEAFCAMIGYSRDEILGSTSAAFTHPDDWGITEESHRRSTAGDADQSRYIKRYLHKDGRVVIADVLQSPARDCLGDIQYFVISETDVTERVNRNNLLRLLSEVNTIATHETDESQLRQQFCDALVTVGNYSLAWIAVTSDNDDGGIEIMCASGATDYLEGDMSNWWGSKDSAHGVTGTALRSGVSQVANDLAHHREIQPWGARARSFGFGSMVAIPDRIGDRRAALVVYHQDAFAFDDVSVLGLEDVVREAELAIVRMRSMRTIADSLEEITVANRSLRESKNALSVSEQRFRLAFEHNMAPMIFSDIADVTFAVNDAFCEMVNRSREELLGSDSRQFTHPADVGITEVNHLRLVREEVDHARYVKRYLRSDGQVVVSEVSKTAARDEAGEMLYFLSSERDITEERALTAQLSHQALHDPLTGLANRILFEDRLSQAHARVLRDGGFGCLMLLDLDDFKGVNDTHGHLIGDQLLVGLAQRFEQVIRSSDTLCRFGGDEFLFLLEGLGSRVEAEEAAYRLLDALTEPFSFAGLRLQQRASIGLVVWDSTNADGTELLRNADVALHEAKSLNKGSYALFAPRMHQKAINSFTLAQELRQALLSGDLAMHYQPIVDLDSFAVVGFEALMRWNHSERGMVPPDLFIPLAEQSHLIVELGAYALHEALKAAKTWDRCDSASSAPYVTVNLSVHQFHDPGLIEMIESNILQSGVDPDRLILEITESAALVNVPETLEVIQHLARIGVRIALDDFGTGFSSLSYLTLLQPRILKIDRSFVSPSHESSQNDTLLEAIISLGDKLNMISLAEGIETTSQLQRLRFLDCRLGQGYLFSPAVPVEQTVAMICRGFANHDRPAGDFNLE